LFSFYLPFTFDKPKVTNITLLRVNSFKKQIKMILITGASGHLGAATIRALLAIAPASDIAVMARDAQKVAAWTAQGLSFRQGDYNDQASLETAMQGIDTLLFISSPDTDDAVRAHQHGNVIRAAVAAGVQDIVYTSMLHTSPDASFLPAASHLRTEETLKASGLSYTILRNTFYADVALQLMGNALESGQWYFAGGDAKANFAARTDMAEALARVLLAPQEHHNKTYEIAAGESHSCAELASIVSELSGRAIQYVPISNEALAEGMRGAGLPEPLVAVLASGAKAIAAGELDSTDPALEQLLGRKPLGLKEALRQVLAV
jgi:NAD(P)H dehydrogenase (quinone)